MFLNNKVYDVLKWIAQFVLPSLATLYFALAAVWGLPDSEAVVGTLMALTVFLGAILGISNMQYQAKIHAIQESTQISFDMTETPKSWLSEDTYELLKWAGLIFLPASGALYFTLSGYWGLPYGEEIVGTIAALTAFMGIMIGATKAKMIR